METRGTLLVRKEDLEGLINLEELHSKGTYPSTYYTLRKNKARVTGENNLMKSAKKNGCDLVVLENEIIEHNGRKYSVRPTFYRINFS